MIEQIINDYLSASGYDATGTCPNGWDGHGKDGKTSYCTKLEYSPRSGYVYYDVKLFFKFGLPVIDNITTFDVSGQTVDLKA